MPFITSPYSQLAPRPFGRPRQLSSAWPHKAASLGDILLLFIYLEIGAMVGIYFKTTRLPVRYLIYVAITALGRVLIEIVGAEHRTGIDILIITGAILLLSFAVLVLRFGSYKYPSERPAADLAR
jgi:protein PsiE